MKVKEQTEYTLPTWAPVYMEYGDAADLEGEDIEAINEFMKYMTPLKPWESVAWDYGDMESNIGFTRRNDITSFGDNCLTALRTVLTEETTIKLLIRKGFWYTKRFIKKKLHTVKY